MTAGGAMVVSKFSTQRPESLGLSEVCSARRATSWQSPTERAPDRSGSHFQDVGHGDGYDYVSGSPHLKHAQLREQLCAVLDATIGNLQDQNRPIEVLEVGAGHGFFTSRLRAGGARVTTTEMSRPSAEYLTRAYAGDPDVDVIYDADGQWAFETGRTFDAVVCLSVLHHIPDYLAAVRRFADITRPGGAFVSWQDPLWYSRLSKSERVAAQVAYYSWRTRQGELLRGVATMSRRLRAVLDPDNPSDMVEYHVVREGVDESALQTLLANRYESVDVKRYWSTQSARWQSWGDSRGYASTFGIVASDRVPSESRPEGVATSGSVRETW
jgi:2-polyprenyl-3-methyl-5-hydroxy-6-metoxy-1,4-benzoquinol methylase